MDSTLRRSAWVAVTISVVACGGARSPATGSAAGTYGQSFDVTVSRPEGGIIQSVDANGQPDGKIDCGPASTSRNACGPASFDWKQQPRLIAAPLANYKFSFWAGDCRGSGDCVVDTSSTGADKWVVAAFVPTATYRGRYFLVTVDPPTGGTVASLDGKIQCGPAGTAANRCGPALYDWAGAAVLSAVPDAGRVFGGWGGDCAGAAGCTLSTASVATDKTVTATFGTGRSVAVTVSGLADMGLTVANLDGTRQGITANGTYSLGVAPVGSTYTIIVSSQPPTQVCTPSATSGVIGASDVLVQLTCACKDQLADCDGSFANGCEANLAYDARNCGACGQVCTTTNGTGACTAGTCGIATCAAGYTQVSGTCIPVARSCPISNGTGTQSWNGTDYGACNVTACDAGYSISNNACVPTVISCTIAHGSGTMTYGTDGYGPCLVIACDVGYGDCDGNALDGCEATLQNDVANCGACGASCQPISHGQVVCENATCVLASCDAGFVAWGETCIPTTIACNVANGSGVETWQGTAYGGCVVTSCAAGYGILDNACVPTTQACTLPNASGTQTLLDGVYGPCVISTCASGFGDCDHADATGCETALQGDVQNCGACGNVCALVANGQRACVAGTCGVSACNAGYTIVAGSCLQTTISCPIPNGTGTQTWAGSAYGPCTVQSCNGGFHVAGGGCAPDVVDCAVANGSGTQTWNGTGYGSCVITACTAGFADCDGVASNGCEVSLQVDVNHCGTCTTVCPAVTNGVPACVAGSCGVASCDAGYTLYGGSCVATRIPCTVANGTGVQLWSGGGYGACTATACEGGYHLYNGACASDVIGCAVANGSGTQTWNGVSYDACVVTACAANYANCDGVSANGCEVALLTDPDDCGACGHVCPAVANGTRGCLAGVCGAAACNAGFSLAGATCVATTIVCTVDHGTGTQTWNGTAYGTCTATGCDAGYHLAGGACASDVIACTVPNGTGTQTWNGTNYAACEVTSCDPGFANCDGASANGCEAVPQTDPDNCGACGVVCAAVANGTRACSAGVCGVASCDPGYTLVNGACIPTTISCTVANGSGTQTWGGTGYGTCVVTSCDPGYHSTGAACDPDAIPCTVANGTGTQTWNGSSYSSCVVNACFAGFADCDRSSVNGCESTPATDPNNCGACGVACPPPMNGFATCTSGTCGIACNAGYHVAAGSCASNTQTCSDSTLHEDGTQTWNATSGTWNACVLTSCSAGYFDCNTKKPDGCETYVWGDGQNCGACNVRCTQGKRCVGGVCQ